MAELTLRTPASLTLLESLFTLFVRSSRLDEEVIALAFSRSLTSSLPFGGDGSMPSFVLSPPPIDWLAAVVLLSFDDVLLNAAWTSMTGLPFTRVTLSARPRRRGKGGERLLRREEVREGLRLFSVGGTDAAEPASSGCGAGITAEHIDWETEPPKLGMLDLLVYARGGSSWSWAMIACCLSFGPNLCKIRFKGKGVVGGFFKLVLKYDGFEDWLAASLFFKGVNE